MKKLTKAFFSLLAGFAMCACSSDNLGNEPQPVLPEEQGDGFFMNLDIQMPNGKTGSRSQTNGDGSSTGGTEIGSDAENNVTSALVVLAAKEAIGTDIEKYGFIAAGEVKSNYITTLTVPGNKEYRATAHIQKTNLNNFYEKLAANTTGNPEVLVFVFCNPTRELTEKFTGANTRFGTAEWIDMTCKVIQGGTGAQQNIGIWGSNSFLMNNAKVVTRMLPKALLDWEKFNNVNNPFHLSENNPEISVDNSSSNTIINGGSIPVERSVARFDFKDGSKLGNATYNVLFHQEAETAGKAPEAVPVINVQLQKMSLVNMSNSFYYLPRVSDDGQLNGAGYELCGAEKAWARDDQTGDYNSGNYVVGPYAAVFGGTTLENNFSTYFNYPFFADNGEFNNANMAGNMWDTYKVSDVLQGRGDNYTGTDGTQQAGQYHVWRYLTENVIPAGPAKQVNGISTGVLFKAKIQGAPTAADAPTANWDKAYTAELAKCLNGEGFKSNGVDHAPIKGNSQDDPILYYLDGHLYMTWPHFRQAAIQASVTEATGNTLEINRSNSVYKAVFGNGPIPAGNVYIKGDGTQVTISDPMWTNDNADWMKSADYAWSQWNAADKPATGEKIDAMRKAITDAGVTIYQSSTDDAYGAGYYCYYYYWNRHNDNGIPGVMGPMEFDVVRNNVYKLSVDKISRLGHPRNPNNDPGKPTPGTPDESDEIYLDVTVNIVPWAVRVNSIEF